MKIEGKYPQKVLGLNGQNLFAKLQITKFLPLDSRGVLYNSDILFKNNTEKAFSLTM